MVQHCLLQHGWPKSQVTISTKGAHVYVEGRLHTRAYEDNSGQKRYWTEVIASDLILLDRREDAEDHEDRSASRQEDRREHAPERRERTPERRHARQRPRAADVL